jgi:hypothetical protein
MQEQRQMFSVSGISVVKSGVGLLICDIAQRQKYTARRATDYRGHFNTSHLP